MTDLSLTQDQRELAEAIAALLNDCAPVSRLRSGTDDGSIHAELAEWGWFRAGLGEDEGGLGLGSAGQALLFLAAGRHLLPPSVLATSLATGLAPPALREDLASGAQHASLAFPGRDGTAWCLDREGASLIVLAGDGQLDLLAADVFAGQPVESFDESLVLEKGRLAPGRTLASAASLQAELLASATLAGIAGAASALAIDYACLREQFGQPIGSFQAVKHRCADMGVAALMAEAQVKMAAACADEAAPDASLQIAAAAHTTLAAALANAAGAIQIHGGIGFTADCDAHRLLKRARVLGQAIGGEASREARLLQIA